MEFPLLQKHRAAQKRRGSSYYTMLRLGGMLFWNGGNSLIGLLGGLGGKAVWHTNDQMLEVSGGWLIWILSHQRWASAITLGDVVLYHSRDLVPILHAHERVHVRQYRVWGPFFLPAYVLESAYQWLRTGDGYRANRFEVAAYTSGEKAT